MEDAEKVTLDSYYIPQKVQAFCKSYMPCEHETEAVEIFTDAKLREYFQAYPMPSVGDLLAPYLEALEGEGYVLKTSVTGEPAIFVTQQVNTPLLLEGLTDDENDI